MTLFDLTDYGGETAKQRRADSRRLSARLPVEPHVEPWVVLRRRDGVAPFFHIPVTVNAQSATVARCGLIGTQVTNLGVDQMIRCPLCVLEAQL